MRRVIDTRNARSAAADRVAESKAETETGGKLSFFLLVARLVILAHARLDALYASQPDPMTTQANARLDKLKTIRRDLATAATEREAEKGRIG